MTARAIRTAAILRQTKGCGMDESTRTERDRCVRCVEAHLPNVKGDTFAERLLLRIANMIRNGEENPEPIGPIEWGHPPKKDGAA